MIGANTIEGRALALADRIENLLIQIEQEQEECREACKPMREDIAEVWKEAKGGNLPEKAMRAYVKVRTAQRKALAKLTDHERDAFRNLREALEPLGQAAAVRAGYGAADDDADVRPRFKQDGEPAEHSTGK